MGVVAYSLVAGLVLAILIAVWFCPVQATIAIIAVTPIWFAIPVPLAGYVYPGTIACLVAIASILFNQWFERLRITWSTAGLGVGFGLAVATGYLWGGLGSALSTPIKYWLAPTILGLLISSSRSLRAKLWKIFRWIGLILACLAILQALTGLDFADVFPVLNPSADTLTQLQERNGLFRAELAWGHSIALSGFLGASLLVWIMDVGVRSSLLLKSSITFVYLTAMFATGSRTAMICFVLCLAYVACYSVRRRIDRGLTLLLIAALSVIAAIVLGSASDGDTSGSYRDSNAYRSDLLDVALKYSNLIGPGDGFVVTDDGVSFRGFLYLDNSFIQIGVSCGLVAALLLLAIYVNAWVRSVLAPTTIFPALIVIQIPGLLSAGFFTQSQMVFWMLWGASCVAVWNNDFVHESHRLRCRRMQGAAACPSQTGDVNLEEART